MARKRKNRPVAAASSDKTFHSSPFRQMEGLHHLVPAQAPSVVESFSDNTSVRPAPGAVAPVADDFAGAMAQLGVTPLATADDGDSVVEAAACPEGAEAPAVDEPRSEREQFLAAIGGLEPCFRDAFAEEEDEEAEPAAAPRRMKLLRQGRLRPQQQLDLHGCNSEQALERVRHFFNRCHHEGLQTVLLITGRGQSSPGGQPVVREAVERFLRQRAQAWVAEWARAPRQYGGEGALVVFLRQSGKSPNGAS
ncbi:Smr/MutS family protein [Desulfuromonas thiophila]|uniref:Smr/MutS family protein n=1 Tax=Desulfuromonas thiophila TaxID=57664 RepID=UPI0024A90CDC|nr:Smr/MutS family protein [Desulfuromonas thiophila]